MTIEQTVSQISQLSIDDQLKIVHAIWDQMGDSNAAKPTVQQTKELDRRMDNYRNDPESALTEADLLEKLKERRERLQVRPRGI